MELPVKGTKAGVVGKLLILKDLKTKKTVKITFFRIIRAFLAGFCAFYEQNSHLTFTCESHFLASVSLYGSLMNGRAKLLIKMNPATT